MREMWFAAGLDMATVLLIVTTATEVRNLRRDKLVLSSDIGDDICEIIFCIRFS